MCWTVTVFIYYIIFFDQLSKMISYGRPWLALCCVLTISRLCCKSLVIATRNTWFSCSSIKGHNHAIFSMSNCIGMKICMLGCCKISIRCFWDIAHLHFEFPCDFLQILCVWRLKISTSRSYILKRARSIIVKFSAYPSVACIYSCIW